MFRVCFVTKTGTYCMVLWFRKGRGVEVGGSSSPGVGKYLPWSLESKAFLCIKLNRSDDSLYVKANSEAISRVPLFLS